jgi:two-component system LytT family sensor kinase
VNGLFLLILQRRDGRPTWLPGELESAVLHLSLGAAFAIVIFRLVQRLPWPRPMRWRFVAFHIVAAPAVAMLWTMTGHLIAPLVGAIPGPTLAERFSEMTVIGSLFYIIVAGLSYGAHGAARAAKAEAAAAQTHLATLRSQLQPHFLFNALHTIVQLIHLDQKRAAEAAELVAELLRRSLEEQRDEVPLRDEWSFVSRYLAVEQIRFGERLVVKAQLPAELENEGVPSFALQTLVENAVQHGAAPRVSPTEIVIAATRNNSALVISVRNDGKTAGTGTGTGSVEGGGTGTGTGLARLRQRLSVLYGGAATLVSAPIATGGYEAVLTIPRKASDA